MWKRLSTTWFVNYEDRGQQHLHGTARPPSTQIQDCEQPGQTGANTTQIEATRSDTEESVPKIEAAANVSYCDRLRCWILRETLLTRYVALDDAARRGFSVEDLPSSRYHSGQPTVFEASRTILHVSRDLGHGVADAHDPARGSHGVGQQRTTPFTCWANGNLQYSAHCKRSIMDLFLHGLHLRWTHTAKDRDSLSAANGALGKEHTPSDVPGVQYP